MVFTRPVPCGLPFPNLLAIFTLDALLARKRITPRGSATLDPPYDDVTDGSGDFVDWWFRGPAIRRFRGFLVS